MLLHHDLFQFPVLLKADNGSSRLVAHHCRTGQTRTVISSRFARCCSNIIASNFDAVLGWSARRSHLRSHLVRFVLCLSRRRWRQNKWLVGHVQRVPALARRIPVYLDAVMSRRTGSRQSLQCRRRVGPLHLIVLRSHTCEWIFAYMGWQWWSRRSRNRIASLLLHRFLFPSWRWLVLTGILPYSVVGVHEALLLAAHDAFAAATAPAMCHGDIFGDLLSELVIALPVVRLPPLLHRHAAGRWARFARNDVLWEFYAVLARG